MSPPGAMKVLASTLAVLAGLAAGPLAAQPLDTAFTYQGRLQDAGAPANGPYDFRFILFDAAVGGAQVGPIVFRDDVVLADGLFTVSLDFGTSAFTGAKRWLDVSVRPGASGGAYTPLSERQELQSAPHSAFSLRTTWTGIAGKPAGFADDVDNDSGGTVTSVGTGAGLTGGPISSTGTVAVAAGGITTALLADAAVTSPKIANGAVGLAQINTGEVQARVGATCPPGQYLRGINPNGTVLCEPMPFVPNLITTVDDQPVNVVGLYSSIAIGADGLPVISYYDFTQGVLKAARCGNAGCSEGNTLAFVDSNLNDVGAYTSIAIGADGLPIISYYDATFGRLKVAKCGNMGCSANNLRNWVDVNANDVGQFTSIAIGADGLPVISYYDATVGDLRVAHCGDAGCTAGNTISIVDASSNVGTDTSIAIGTDGFPIISYRDVAAGDLKVAHCGNAACSAGNTVVTVDPVNDAGYETSIAIGADGLPVISYNDLNNLKVAHCGNTACTAGNTVATVDPGSSRGWFTSIAIGTDGLPVVSYQDAAAGALKVAHCGDKACTAANALTTVDAPPANSVGPFTSIEIGADGLPIVSYWDNTAGALKAAKCVTRTCQ
jgi:hypothetical protein